MLKKRLIFTLLFDGTSFVLSRNFRLQRVGTIHWLKTNFSFLELSRHIDELIILNVNPSGLTPAFLDILSDLASNCFIPISAGGGVSSLESANLLLHNGADKIVVNSLLYHNLDKVKKIAQVIGSQSVVASIDCSYHDSDFFAYHDYGKTRGRSLSDFLNQLVDHDVVGEIYLNSINNDGSGQGLNLAMLNHFPTAFSIPTILAGGAGTAEHLSAGLACPQVDAVATANLLNFVGSGLEEARISLLSTGHDLPQWDPFDSILTS